MFSTRFGRGWRREEKTRGADGETAPASALPKGLKHQFSERDLPPGHTHASYAYWRQARQGGSLPLVRAIEPTRLPRE